MRKMKTARGESHQPAKKLSHIEIREANGGHVVRHHFQGGMGYQEPEEHVFSSGEGDKLMAHLGSAANIDSASGDGKPEHSKELEAKGA